MDSIVVIILIVVLFVILIILANYNRLISLLNRIKRDKANIEICLKKRFDLVPNLIECIKAYSKYEKGTLEEIVSLRNNYNKKDGVNIKDANDMDKKLNKYLAVVEAYPELKANEEYLSLQKELTSIENQLVNLRYGYNDDVTRYNIAIEKVPSNIVASMFGFKKAELFKINEDEKENIKVKI